MLIIENDISKVLNDWLLKNSNSQVFILVDENTEKLCFSLLKLQNKAVLIKIKSGEEFKTLNTCQFIWSELLQNKADRKALLINLGGGVICDMGAFCASTYKRGIDFVNIPTTLLSQVDASVGSKTGIDFQEQKNMIGLFSDAKEIIIDSVFLKTLEKRELLSGLAEVLKHGLILDYNYFADTISSYNSSKTNWLEIIRKSIEIKSKIVKADPTEKGLRKILNFGHTVGHALESFSLKCHNKPIKHGEAVIIGMIAELYLSNKKMNLCQLKMDETIQQLLTIYSFKKLEAYTTEEVFEFALNDKKNNGNNISCVLLEDLGKAKYDVLISKSEFSDALHFLTKTIQSD